MMKTASEVGAGRLVCLAAGVAMTLPAHADIRTPEQARQQTTVSGIAAGPVAATRRVANPPAAGVGNVVYNAISNADKPPVSLLLLGEKSGDWRAEMKEDLATMSHLISKRIAGAGGGNPIGSVMQHTMGINVVLSSMAGHPKADYIDGYGAIFRTSVGFPLMEAEEGGGGVDGQVAAEKEPSEWEKARRELSGARPAVPSRGGGGASRYRIAGTASYVDAVNLAGSYSRERVEALRRDVIAGLQAAKNIRGLGEGDVVVVQITGPAAAKPVPAGGAGSVQPKREARPVNTGAAGTVQLYRDPKGVMWPYPMGMPGGKSGMNFRVKAADLRRLAAGEVDDEAFAVMVEEFGYHE